MTDVIFPRLCHLLLCFVSGLHATRVYFDVDQQKIWVLNTICFSWNLTHTNLQTQTSKTNFDVVYLDYQLYLR